MEISGVSVVTEIRTRLDILMDEDIKARAKAKAAIERTTLSAVVQGFLKAWVEGKIEKTEDTEEDRRRTRKRKK